MINVHSALGETIRHFPPRPPLLLRLHRAANLVVPAKIHKTLYDSLIVNFIWSFAECGLDDESGSRRDKLDGFPSRFLELFQFSLVELFT